MEIKLRSASTIKLDVVPDATFRRALPGLVALQGLSALLDSLPRQRTALSWSLIPSVTNTTNRNN